MQVLAGLIVVLLAGAVGTAGGMDAALVARLIGEFGGAEAKIEDGIADEELDGEPQPPGAVIVLKV